MSRLVIEVQVRQLFNQHFSRNANKQILSIGNNNAQHEFDIYEAGRIIGGISTSPWFNKTEKHSSNTGGQDRVTAELLWLTLWQGNEKRVIILTDQEMAKRIHQRFSGCPFTHTIEIFYCDLENQSFTPVGKL